MKKVKYTTIANPKNQRQVAGFNPFASLTIEDLKENRSEIISIISEHTDKVKEVMSYMVAIIDTKTNIEDLTTTAIYDLGLNKMVDNSEYYREESKKQLGSSMR